MRNNLLIGIISLVGCLGLLSGCSVFTSTEKLGDRVQEIDGFLQRLSLELETAQDPERKVTIISQMDLLREERESLTVKIKVAQKAKQGVGSGIESLLGILGILVGVPLLGSAGAVAKLLITGGKV